MLIVGLTGGIGSGKSAVAEGFARHGVEVVDTDAIAHALSEPGAAGNRSIRAAFGGRFFAASGELDRAALRAHVFADAAARGQLESILHPLIGAEVRRTIERWAGTYGIVVVPLLLEKNGTRRWIDRVLVVDAPEDEQIRRVASRSKMSDDEVRAIMATQMDRRSRLAAADDIIDNAGSREALAPQIAALDQHYRDLAMTLPHRPGSFSETAPVPTSSGGTPRRMTS